ncbi:MAG: hypothetical protein H6622_17600 [Halobacteriovoraceae bacterium]|nr:hypothetical protein [Halobacteriovoraceae bacterium]
MKFQMALLFLLFTLSTHASESITYECSVFESGNRIVQNLFITYSDDRTVSVKWEDEDTSFYDFEHAPNESIVTLKPNQYLQAKHSRFINDFRHYTEVQIEVFINLKDAHGWFSEERGANEDQFDYENLSYELKNCTEID